MASYPQDNFPSGNCLRMNWFPYIFYKRPSWRMKRNMLAWNKSYIVSNSCSSWNVCKILHFYTLSIKDNLSFKLTIKFLQKRFWWNQKNLSGADICWEIWGNVSSAQIQKALYGLLKCAVMLKIFMSTTY